MKTKYMKLKMTLRTGWLGAMAFSALVLSGFAYAAPEKPLPSSSVYQLAMPLTDQRGRTSQLADWRGRPVMISMFYTNCEFVCPRIVEALKRTEEQLSAGGNAKLPVLIVTFDPTRDDVNALRQAADERHLDDRIWTLARTDARNVRKLAALLNIQYRELPSGGFNHTSVLILLDAEGRIVGRTLTLGEADPAFVKLTEKVIHTARAK